MLKRVANTTQELKKEKGLTVNTKEPPDKKKI